MFGGLCLLKTEPALVHTEAELGLCPEQGLKNNVGGADRAGLLLCMPSCLFELLPPICDMKIQAVLSSWEM